MAFRLSFWSLVSFRAITNSKTSVCSTNTISPWRILKHSYSLADLKLQIWINMNQPTVDKIINPWQLLVGRWLVPIWFVPNLARPHGPMEVVKLQTLQICGICAAVTWLTHSSSFETYETVGFHWKKQTGPNWFLMAGGHLIFHHQLPFWWFRVTTADPKMWSDPCQKGSGANTSRQRSYADNGIMRLWIITIFGQRNKFSQSEYPQWKHLYPRL